MDTFWSALLTVLQGQTEYEKIKSLKCETEYSLLGIKTKPKLANYLFLSSICRQMQAVSQSHTVMVVDMK